MYPSLYHFLYQTFGIDLPILKVINSFGFFVAIAFIVASYLMAKEFERKHNDGVIPSSEKTVTRGQKISIASLISNGFIGFILGFKIIYLLFNVKEATVDPPAFFLSGTGSLTGGLLMSALFVFLQFRDHQKEKKKYSKPTEVKLEVLPQHMAGNITIVAAIFGILGAKLFHLLENPKELVDFFTSFSADNFLSGLTIYGGLIIGGAAVLIYMKRNGIQPLKGADANVPGLWLSYGIGRMGCHFSGDGDWGIVNSSPKPSFLPDWLWSYSYPNNVLHSGVPIPEDVGIYIHQDYGRYLDPGVYPTPLYEIIFSFVIFAILWKVRKRFTIPGVFFCVYLMTNGLERFWIEKIRVNTKLFGMDITQAEIISVMLFFLGLFGIFYLRKKHKLKMANA